MMKKMPRALLAVNARAKLPEITAPERREALAFEPDQSAIERWTPAVRAAVEGDENVLSIYGVIGEDWMGEGWTARRVAAALRRIGRGDVTVNLNSPGGDFFEGVAIY